MKKIASKPEISVTIHRESVALKCAPCFCFEGDEMFFPWLKSYAEKKPLPSPPFRLNHLSPFTQRILSKLMHIPFGTTCAYSDLDPKAARAVGSACGRNPYPLFIPCHRVTRKHSIGGFALDLEIKRRLLNFEKTP